ncbi:MAG: OsmC family protein [Boseongicola sp. SB0670_bin_30]|nr:OsmC family protein [Boseongicola sp. SB0670_bin_30]
MASAVDNGEFSKPVIRRKALTASNDGTLATVARFGGSGEFTFGEPAAHGGSGKGPAPLAGVLASLCGREAVTFGRTARETGLEHGGVELDSAFTIDIRGRSGMRGVVPQFQTVKVEARVRTWEGEARLKEVVEETEARCPDFNLIKDAGVRIEMVWIRDADDAGGMVA